MEDCENDASLAFSSGKNSRRKLSVLRNYAKEYDENAHESGRKSASKNFLARNVFESSSKQGRCLQDNDILESMFNNAPRKSC